MNFQFALISDMHIEGAGSDVDIGPARLLAAVGDIYAPEPRMKKGSFHPAIDWLANKAPDVPILFVPGNHDYEGNRVFDALSIMRESAKGTNVHVLWNDTFDFEGVRFLGTPLFTDFSFQGRLTREEMSKPVLNTDMARSFDQRGNPLTPRWMARHHKAARKFLSRELATDVHIPKVVLTHWCPTDRVMKTQFSEERNNAYWISPCEDLVEKASVWCFGHTHLSLDMRIGDNPDLGRMVSNARGHSKSFNLAPNNFFVQPRLISV